MLPRKLDRYQRSLPPLQLVPLSPTNKPKRSRTWWAVAAVVILGGLAWAWRLK